MNSRLSQYIKEHREEFDDELPSPGVWEGINKKLPSVLQSQLPAGKTRPIRWYLAAAAVVLVAFGTWFLMDNPFRGKQPSGELAVSPKASIQKTQPKSISPAAIQNTDSSKTIQASSDLRAGDEKGTDLQQLQSDAQQEMVHYAKIVEIKQRELKILAKDEPQVYQQFSDDLGKLDSVYHKLEFHLSKKQNSEQLLEAMIQNLQLQMQILNKQLHIIKQLNQSKKEAYEKAYQSI
jgi:hypothetical protein